MPAAVHGVCTSTSHIANDIGQSWHNTEQTTYNEAIWSSNHMCPILWASSGGGHRPQLSQGQTDHIRTPCGDPIHNRYTKFQD